MTAAGSGGKMIRDNRRVSRPAAPRHEKASTLASAESEPMSDLLTGGSKLPPRLETQVRAELQTGERLVWVGQPRPDLVMRAAYFLVPFGLLFGGFAVFWITTASSFRGGGGPALFDFFPCFGIPFVLIGLALVASPVWLRRKAGNTVYALTDRRAILWEPGWFGAVTVRSYAAAGLGRMARRDRAGGAGDLVFEEFVTSSTNSDGHTSSTTHQRGFLCIDRVREVEDLVRRTLLS